MKYTQRPLCIVICAFTLLNATACTPHPPVGFPPPADIAAVTEAKPLPSPDILTDPAASDRYGASVESWGERVQAAGVRLCRFFAAQGMKADCGE